MGMKCYRVGTIWLSCRKDDVIACERDGIVWEQESFRMRTSYLSHGNEMLSRSNKHMNEMLSRGNEGANTL